VELRFTTGLKEILPRESSEISFEMTRKLMSDMTYGILKSLQLRFGFGMSVGLLMAVLACSDVHAGNPPPRLRFQRIGLEQGLPTLSVEDVVRDSDGFLWISTVMGLCRYDGYRSRVFQIDTGAQDRANSWFSYLVMREDSIGAQIGNANAWYVFDRRTLKFTKLPPKAPFVEVIRKRDVSLRTKGWRIVEGNILVGDDGTRRRICDEENDVCDLVEIGNDVWISTIGGLYIYHTASKTISIYKHDPNDPASLGPGNVRHVYQDSKGEIWVTTYGGGLSRVIQESPHFTTVPTLPSRRGENGGYVFRLAQDKQGRIWCATSSGGLQSFDPKNGAQTVITTSTTRLTIPKDDLREVYVDEKGLLWSGYGQLWCADLIKKRCRKFDVDAWEVIKKTSDGMMWLYRHNVVNDSLSFVRYDPLQKIVLDTFAEVPGDSSSLSNNEVREVYEDSKRRIWIATRNGLNLFNPATKKYRRFHYNKTATQQSGLSYHGPFYIQAIVEDNHGNLWLGTRGGGLICFNTQNYTSHIYGRESGVSDLFVYALSIDSLGNLWLGTSSGLMRFSIPDKHVIEVYTTDDGLLSNEFNTLSAVNLRDGRIAMGGLKGYHIFNPVDLIEKTLPPAIHISRIAVNGSEYVTPLSCWNITTLNLEHNQNTIALDFSSPEYRRSNKVKYQYAIEGQSASWIDAPLDRRLLLTALQPGSYLLMMRSSYNGVQWNESFRFSINISPPLWQRTWFIVLGLLLVVVCVVLLTQYIGSLKYRTQIERLEKHKALMQQRSQISLDMHDDVGTTVTRILTLSRISLPDDSSKAAERMHRIESLAASLIDSIRQIVWALNPENDALNATVATLRSYVVETLHEAGIVVTVESEGQIDHRILSLAVRRNLYLVVKEAVNNIIRHADATNCRISVSVVDNCLTLVLTDNGRGYQQEGRTGNGMVSMKRRIEAVGGELTIHTEQGIGTTIKIACPVHDVTIAD
jgi:signal transduction histidine kinase/ligand-binding sensor domain-containing protein